MPVGEGRIKNIEASVNRLDTRMTSLETQLKSPNPLGERVTNLEGRIEPNWILRICVGVFLGYCGWLGLRVVDMGTDIGVIKQTLIPQRLSQAATDPTNPNNIKEVKGVLSTAKKKDIRIDPNIIKDTANKFIAVTDTQPMAWQAVSQYMDYRSFLNTSLAPSLAELAPIKYSAKYEFFIRALSTKAEVTWKIRPGPTDSKNTARLEVLGTSNPTNYGAELIGIEGKGFAVMLDNVHMKNVVIKGLDVEYNGGRVLLENVYFVNCTFHLKLTPKSRELGKAILASTAVTFKSVT